MVEAAGQLIHLFRDGPDYAITHASCSKAWVRSVLSITRCRWILVPALLVAEVSRSMSLYRAGLRLALFLPLGVTSRSQLERVRLHRCEPHYHFTLAGEGDPSLIEPASASPTFQDLHA